MTVDEKGIDEKQSLMLSAYHDGELSRLGRWRVGRHLRRSAALRRELAELAKLSGVVREIESPPASFVTPDPWSEIGPALSAIDREIDGERSKSRVKGLLSGLFSGIDRRAWSNREGATPPRARMGMVWGSLATGGALAVLVLALVVDNQDTILEDSTQVAYGETVSGSLRYLRTNGVSYVVSQDSEDVTIIWLMDADGAAEGV